MNIGRYAIQPVAFKGGFVDFRIDGAPATLVTFFSSVNGLRADSVNGVLYPGGGLQGHLGPIGLRLDVGDEIYFNHGAHNNLRVAFGPVSNQVAPFAVSSGRVSYAATQRRAGNPSLREPFFQASASPRSHQCFSLTSKILYKIYVMEFPTGVLAICHRCGNKLARSEEKGEAAAS